MSQNVEIVDVESIEIGRRIKEILEEKKQEKGNAFSIRAFAKRIGMGKDMLGDIIKGYRPVRPSELEKIAQGLGIAVSRLKGEDTKVRQDELMQLVKNQTNLKRAMQIAQELLCVAVGCTEKCFILNSIGTINYLSKQYENARDSWTEALFQAQQIRDLNKDSSQVYKVTRNLIHAYTELKDLISLTKLLDSLEPQFSSMNELSAGTLIHAQAMTAFNLGNLKLCREYMYKLLNIYENLQPLYKWFAFQNVANIEYLLENYSTSKGFFEKAITEISSESLKSHVESRMISVKDYCKCLIKLNENDKALPLIETSLQELQSNEMVGMKAKFLLLHAVVTDSPESADNVLSLGDIGANLKILACDFLMKFYSRLGDSSSIVKYYNIAESFKSAQINWEGI